MNSQDLSPIPCTLSVSLPQLPTCQKREQLIHKIQQEVVIGDMSPETMAQVILGLLVNILN